MFPECREGDQNTQKDLLISPFLFWHQRDFSIVHRVDLVHHHMHSRSTVDVNVRLYSVLVLSTYVVTSQQLFRSNPVRILPKIPGKMQMLKSAKIPKNAKLRRSAMQLQSLLQRSAIGRSLSLSSTFLLRCNEKCPSSTGAPVRVAFRKLKYIVFCPSSEGYPFLFQHFQVSPPSILPFFRRRSFFPRPMHNIISPRTEELSHLHEPIPPHIWPLAGFPCLYCKAWAAWRKWNKKNDMKWQ